MCICPGNISRRGWNWLSWNFAWWSTIYVPDVSSSLWGRYPNGSQKSTILTLNWFVTWNSGRTLVFNWRTFPVLRLTCSWRVTTYMGKLSAAAIGQPTRLTYSRCICVFVRETYLGEGETDCHEILHDGPQYMSWTCLLPFGGGTPRGPQNPQFWA